MNNWPRYYWIFDFGKIIVCMLAYIVFLPLLIPLLLMLWIIEKTSKQQRSAVVETEPVRRPNTIARKTKKHKHKKKRRGV